MRKVEEFQETQKLMDEYNAFDTKIPELEKQIEVNKEKADRRIAKLEEAKQPNEQDDEFKLDRNEIIKQCEEQIKKEEEELSEKNKPLSDELEEVKDSKKYFRTDAHFKTITMEIESMKKEVTKGELELKEKDIELQKFRAEENHENPLKWQEIYKEQDELRKDIKALNAKIEEYSKFKEELNTINLTPEEYKEMFKREEERIAREIEKAKQQSEMQKEPKEEKRENKEEQNKTEKEETIEQEEKNEDKEKVTQPVQKSVDNPTEEKKQEEPKKEPETKEDDLANAIADKKEARENARKSHEQMLKNSGIVKGAHNKEDDSSDPRVSTIAIEQYRVEFNAKEQSYKLFKGKNEIPEYEMSLDEFEKDYDEFAQNFLLENSNGNSNLEEMDYRLAYFLKRNDKIFDDYVEAIKNNKAIKFDLEYKMKGIYGRQYKTVELAEDLMKAANAQEKVGAKVSKNGWTKFLEKHDRIRRSIFTIRAGARYLLNPPIDSIYQEVKAESKKTTNTRQPTKEVKDHDGKNITDGRTATAERYKQTEGNKDKQHITPEDIEENAVTIESQEEAKRALDIDEMFDNKGKEEDFIDLFDDEQSKEDETEHKKFVERNNAGISFEDQAKQAQARKENKGKETSREAYNGYLNEVISGVDNNEKVTDNDEYGIKEAVKQMNEKNGDTEQDDDFTI